MVDIKMSTKRILILEIDLPSESLILNYMALIELANRHTHEVSQLNT